MSLHDLSSKNNGNDPKDPQNPGSNAGTPLTAVPNFGGSVTPANNPNNDQPDILIDYEKEAEAGNFLPISFRDDVINAALSILTTKKHPNVLLTGPAGAGKTAIAEELALRLYNNDALATGMLGKKTKIYELQLSDIVAGSGIVGEVEEKINNVLNFIMNPDNHAILYIDEIHRIMNTSDPSTQKIGQILKPALSRSDLHVIASTTTQESKMLRTDPAFSRRFSQLIVPELNDAQTKEILAKLIPVYQKHHGVSIPNTVLDTVINVADKYANNYQTHRPDSAMTVLDRACGDTHLNYLEQKAQGFNNIMPIITDSKVQNAGLNLLSISSNYRPKKSMQDVKYNLTHNIVGQKDARTSLIKMVAEDQLNLTSSKKPHSYLFAGPTGTGKTEIAKQLADGLFGSADNLLSLNMTEYNSDMAVTRLIGSSDGYVGSDSNQPKPLDPLMTNPFQIVLLDEFEKAAPAVQKIFMQALEEGYIMTSHNEIIDFSHAIVIATSNAGAQQMVAKKHTIGFGDTQKADKINQMQILQQKFPPELLNRFNRIIMFDSLTQTEYQYIVALKYNKLIAEAKQNRPDIKLLPESVDLNNPPAFLREVAKQSYDPARNGRPAENVVDDYVKSNILANSNRSIIDFNIVTTIMKP